jgi:hypothetical protein
VSCVLTFGLGLSDGVDIAVPIDPLHELIKTDNSSEQLNSESNVIKHIQ